MKFGLQCSLYDAEQFAVILLCQLSRKYNVSTEAEKSSKYFYKISSFDKFRS